VNKQLEVDASEIRFRAERRIGELMGVPVANPIPLVVDRESSDAVA
jgi:hypothetical protein